MTLIQNIFKCIIFSTTAELLHLFAFYQALMYLASFLSMTFTIFITFHPHKTWYFEGEVKNNHKFNN